MTGRRAENGNGLRHMVECPGGDRDIEPLLSGGKKNILELEQNQCSSLMPRKILNQIVHIFKPWVSLTLQLSCNLGYIPENQNTSKSVFRGVFAFLAALIKTFFKCWIQKKCSFLLVSLSVSLNFLHLCFTFFFFFLIIGWRMNGMVFSSLSDSQKSFCNN